MAEATFTPAPKPEGVVTITLTESEARRFIAYRPSWTPTYTYGNKKDYGTMRDQLQDVVESALAHR